MSVRDRQVINVQPAIATVDKHLIQGIAVDRQQILSRSKERDIRGSHRVDKGGAKRDAAAHELREVDCLVIDCVRVCGAQAARSAVLRIGDNARLAAIRDAAECSGCNRRRQACSQWPCAQRG